MFLLQNREENASFPNIRKKITKMISKSPMRKKGWVPFKNIDKRITNNCLPFSISPLKRRQTCRFFLLVVLQQYQISRALLSIVFLPLVKFCQYISSTPSNGSLKHHLSLVGCFWLVSDKIIILFRMSTRSLLRALQIQAEKYYCHHLVHFQPFLVQLQPFWSILTPFGAKFWGS